MSVFSGFRKTLTAKLALFRPLKLVAVILPLPWLIAVIVAARSFGPSGTILTISPAFRDTLCVHVKPRTVPDVMGTISSTLAPTLSPLQEAA
jgi:hypothetical protein